jgi:hypothetical protein
MKAGTNAKNFRFSLCCGSSVVEHSLGKGEAESSILSRSTSKINSLTKYLKSQGCSFEHKRRHLLRL